ncbi:MAG: hypothetical protein ABIJ09_11280 [Pseudomonadota bacterium]
MTSIRKPDMPAVVPRDLDKTLDRLGDAIKTARSADGSVDVEKLEHAVEATGDRALDRSLEAIKDSFARTEERSVPAGCSGGTSTRSVQVDPKKLDSGEVQNVMSALLAAKQEVRALDKNGDGRLDRKEAEASDRLQGLSGKLADAAVDGSLESFRTEMSAWNDALSKVSRDIDGRKNLDVNITRKASQHAATMTGAEAITWAYRDLASQPAGVDIWDMDERLKNAETHFLRHIPLFSRLVTGDQHLSDREVGKLLGTDDLAGFAARKKAEIEARLGGEYQGHYLAGKDLPGVEQLGDPDFKKVSSGC